KAFGIGTYLLQDSQRFAAALILKLLKRQAQGLPQSIVENLHAEPLHGKPHDVFLKRTAQPGQQRNGDSDSQPDQYAPYQFLLAAATSIIGIVVDDFPENDRVDHREQLGSGSQ